MRFRQDGLTLLELIVVLTILATLGTVMLTQSTSLTNEARYQQTVRTLEALDAAVVGDPGLRGPDGQRLVTGFVADMGRLPVALDELWEIGELQPFAIDKTPAGDADLDLVQPALAVGGGWRGPYLRLPLGADNLTDGWGRPYEALDGNGDAVGDLRMVRSLGPDGLVGGTGFQRDLLTVFEATPAAAENPDLAGLVSVVPSRFAGGVVLSGVVADDGAGGIEDPGDALVDEPELGEFVVVRIYGPNPVTGGVQTVAEFVHDLNDAPDGDGSEVALTPLPGLDGGDLTIGPRVIRAYQVVAIPETPEENLNPTSLDAPNPATRISDPIYFVNIPGGLPPLPELVLEAP
ncbi:MAG: prepilin-type N-terminal cleavage/methylation domain-containing protein [Pseudomonadota bacterium]